MKNEKNFNTKLVCGVEDVLDLAWSTQDRWLASSSVDNNIIVWDVNNLPTMAAILKSHTGLVKGVCWDPVSKKSSILFSYFKQFLFTFFHTYIYSKVGKFLASQSDDRTIKIWRTSDWSCESTITEPFEECSGTTNFLRLSWSPDGS